MKTKGSTFRRSLLCMPMITRLALQHFACIAILGIGGEPVYAQDMETLAADVGSCALIEAAPERLACYDEVSKSLATTEPPARTTAENTAPGPVGDDPPSATDTPPPVDADSNPQDLGAEQLPNSDEVDELVSYLVGPFNGWDGDTIFRLGNGQAWQQIDSSYQYARSERPRVTISRAAFGSYLLQVEGVGQTVRVRRIE